MIRRYKPTLPKTIHYASGVSTDAQDVLAQTPQRIFQRFIEDQEQPTALYAAHQLLSAHLSRAPESRAEITAACNTGETHEIAVAPLITFLAKAGKQLVDQFNVNVGRDRRLRGLALTERSVISQIAGCWLDTISQPATQPDPSVNILFGQHFKWLGEGTVENAVPELRRRVLNRAGVMVPAVIDHGYITRTEMSGSTALYGAFLVALSRFPVNYYPEVVGVHIAYHALAIDEQVLGVHSGISHADLAHSLTVFLAEKNGAVDGPAWIDRMLCSVALILDLERENMAVLSEIAQKARNQSLDSRVAEIVAKHAPKAGKQHDKVVIAGQAMSRTFAEGDVDMQAFMEKFRKSFYLRKDSQGSCRFMQSLKFGGPMFGIFTEDQSKLFADWAAQIPATADQPIVLTTTRPDDPDLDTKLAVIRDHRPSNAVDDDTLPADDRELFFRLVNIENYPNTLAVARSRAETGLEDAKILFQLGSAGRFTDGTMFDYSPDALFERVEQIYWDKLIGPYQPLAEIPNRDQVIFDQKTFALGNLVDGSWSFKVGNMGRYDRISDGKLFLIYADEMGLGDIRKNHITLIYDVLESMDITLPHIADQAFLDQDELPEVVYAFAINQLALAQFPDSRYPEIIGYNLGIEMFGLGEMRMHEIQKLKHHGFSAIYEEAHLSIDNASSGHARQSAEIVVDYLDHVRRNFGEMRVQEEWQRVWNGYCSFARFVETSQINFDTPPAVSASAETLDTMTI